MNIDFYSTNKIINYFENPSLYEITILTCRFP